MASIYGMELDERVPALETRSLVVSRRSEPVVKNLSMAVPAHRVVALVGPSGGGKTILLKCFNRMNDLDPELQIRGEVLLFGDDIYHPDVDPVEVRRRVGMVFQRSRPFPTSIMENVAFGPRVNRLSGDVNLRVEKALRKAALWEEVNDRLFEPAHRLSAGQQQRLCLARTLAVEPDLLLLDEPAADLDPGSTQRVEELIHLLKESHTVVIVTHNLQHAARVSDFVAFFDGGELIEYGPTGALFTNPREKRTEAYLTGRRP